MTIDTPFLKQVAVCTILIIVFVFALGAFKSKAKNRSTPSAIWDIGSYYMYVKALITSSLTMEQLYANQTSMKAFLGKPFRGAVSNKERLRYYNRILEVYCRKERELHTAELKILTT
jgi:hypothetical protein